jgi:hypothetical protein
MMFWQYYKLTKALALPPMNKTNVEKKVKKRKTKKLFDEVNWHSLITLSTAGAYITDRINEELEKFVPVKPRKKSKPNRGK